MHRSCFLIAAALLVQGCAASGDQTASVAGGRDRIAVIEASYDMSSAPSRLPRDRNKALQQVLNGLLPTADALLPDTTERPERPRPVVSRTPAAPAPVPAAPAQVAAAAAPIRAAAVPQIPSITNPLAIRTAPAGRVTAQPLPAPARPAPADLGGIDVGASPALRGI